MTEIARWLRDCAIPMLDGLPSKTTPPIFAIPDGTKSEVLKVIHERLKAEATLEADRMKIADTKLVAVGAMAPVATTLLVAAVTFITSRPFTVFTSTSIIGMLGIAFYVALQFLLALIRSIRGLSTRAYSGSVIGALSPAPREALDAYLATMCIDIARHIEQHRDVTNTKFDQLRVAHRAVLNAVGGLLIAIIALGAIAISESLKAP